MEQQQLRGKYQQREKRRKEQEKAVAEGFYSLVEGRLVKVQQQGKQEEEGHHVH